MTHDADARKTFTEYFQNIKINFVNAPMSYGEHSIKSNYQLDVMNRILDINESWIDYAAERFMVNLLQQPYAYPDQKLTRGEVAKLLCRDLFVVPMRNEQIFSDVELADPNSRYIWAISQLGIMNGDGDGTFRPDDTLSMQEFAVIASRMIQYGKEKSIDNLNNLEATLLASEYYELYTEQEKAAMRVEREKRIEEFEPPADLLPKVFADSDQIASWAKAAVDELSRFRILQGDLKEPYKSSNSSLHPTETLSKTRFLVFLYKLDQELRLSEVGSSVLF
jgi:hypothetical protein